MTDMKLSALKLPENPVGALRVRTGVNYLGNPRGKTLAGVGGAPGTNGAGGRTILANGGPLAVAPTFIRHTITTVPTSGTMSIFWNDPALTAVDAADAGKKLSLVLYARTSKPTSGVYLTLGLFKGDTFDSTVNGAGTPTQANVWTPIGAVTATILAGVTRVQAQASFAVGNFTQALAAGDTLDISAGVLYLPETGYTGTYLDGDMAGAKWLGQPHASRSTKIVGAY